MRLFFEITRRSLLRQFSYRTANLAGLVTNLFFAILRVAVLAALYQGRPQVEGITLQGAITYAGMCQAVIAFLSLFGWYEIMNSVNSGEVGADLLKPVGFFTYWMAQDLGRAIASLLTRGLTLMLVFALFYPISTPPSPGYWLAFLLALLLSWMVSFAWRFLVNLAAFWSPQAGGVGRFLFGLAWIFSGFIMPLPLFPDWFIRLANFTPFPAMVNTVILVYLGQLSGLSLATALLLQAAWFAALALMGQAVLRLGLRSLVVQGG